MHSEETTAVLTANEPPNGTKLIVQKGGDWVVVLRDDDAARSWDAYEGDRWFEGMDHNHEPMSLHQHVKDADAVYALGEKLAEFRRAAINTDQ